MNLIKDNPKVSITIGASMFVGLVVWILSLFGISVPIEIQGTLGVIAAILIARWTRISGTDAQILEQTKDELT